MGNSIVRRMLARVFPKLRTAFLSGRGWERFYRGQHQAAIPDLEIAWRREHSPILVGGPLGEAYARVGRDEDALRVLEELAAAVRARSKELESNAGWQAAVAGLAALASLLDKHHRSEQAREVRVLVEELSHA
jgi:hypothetical protein